MHFQAKLETYLKPAYYRNYCNPTMHILYRDKCHHTPRRWSENAQNKLNMADGCHFEEKHRIIANRYEILHSDAH